MKARRVRTRPTSYGERGREHGPTDSEPEAQTTGSGVLTSVGSSACSGVAATDRGFRKVSRYPLPHGLGSVWRHLVLGLFLLTSPAIASGPDLHIQVDDPSLWRPVLRCVGLQPVTEPARFRIVLGDSESAAFLGFRPTDDTARVASVTDTRDPQLDIVWEQPVELPVYDLPPGARVFARERRTGTPLLAGIATEEGGVLWVITRPGPGGFERFPFLLHALVDLGLSLPFRSHRTWAFLDTAYRTRADPAYLAARWRQAGLSAIHMSAWHFHDPGEVRDAWLENLIAACHRQGILVYGWLELPHVSESFWRQQAACREQTAILQDAKLDWRKLMNLADPACFARVKEGIERLIQRFDWDGVNLAELYFESLHGPSNPQRFTPMNRWVRADFQSRTGMDPLDLFQSESPSHWTNDREKWHAFAAYRTQLLVDLQDRLLDAVIETDPQLDLSVTQIDDRFDTRMREYLGTDTASLLAGARERGAQFVVEDPATLWDLGPGRYPQIAERYRDEGSAYPRLAVDINIVERYQNVYPTKKQVGAEFLQLVNSASQAFPRVLLYQEHSISRADIELMANAAQTVTHAQWHGKRLEVVSRRPTGIKWSGDALVDGVPWPAADGYTLWLPAGRHFVQSAHFAAPWRLLHLTADLLDARMLEDGLEFSYQAYPRSIALVGAKPSRVFIDGNGADPQTIAAQDHTALLLPSGRHRIRVTYDSPEGGPLQTRASPY